MTREMGRAEIDDLLQGRGAGVLSLTDGSETYGIPESFGYDGELLYFQLVYDGDSEKMQLMESTETASFTVFTEEPAESVLVRGALERVPETAQTRAATAIAENANIPTLNVFPNTGPDDLSMAFFQLVPEEFSGRKFNNRVPK